MRFLRHKIDRWPVGIIIFTSLIDFVIYFVVDDLKIIVAYWLLVLPVKAKLSAFNHHHQHLFTFMQKPLNRCLEFLYALHTGATTNLWVLHHVLGHHAKYLDQPNDPSRWKDQSGSQMNVLKYSFQVFFTAYPRAFEIGQSYQRFRKDFVRYSFLVLVFVSVLTFFKPFHALFLFIFPMITSLFLTSMATYGHHSGLDVNDHFHASKNNLGKIYNWSNGNLGYHTAHHYRQAVHWSKLPELHKNIESEIPIDLIKGSSKKPTDLVIQG